MTDSNDLDRVGQLKQMRDEIRLQAHLAKAEAKDEWVKAEAKWDQLKQELPRIDEATDDIIDKMSETELRELLKILKIENAINLMPEELSGGMQRRVAIARSLAGCEPKMMLYDEATTGLDPLTADNICNLINELSKGDPPGRVGFIIVTHKVTDAVKVAERYIFIRNGNIIFDGDIEELKKTEDPLLRKFINELYVAKECE